MRVQDPPASVVESRAAAGTQYAEPPKSGYATQVTGGTGTTALAQGQDINRGSHMTGAANVLDPE